MNLKVKENAIWYIRRDQIRNCHTNDQLSSLKAADLASLVETEEIVRHGNMKFIIIALFVVFAAMQMEYVQALECNEVSQAKCVIECRGDRDAGCTRGFLTTTCHCHKVRSK
ncbi:hypothetical protein TSAR_013194 [Trichomalopsis sarcophagae]|uniref:Invertebrate defensins family profile domain-containing protein n=1 Tax=Trichomalopsis sarcophagae TaxID=543379 RepID=A0A232FCG9_9HYME|nr:hypothetical protein TSAR_013194 [Trichomalopsis sarcophagae]